MINVVEQSCNVCAYNPVDVQFYALVAQFNQSLVLAVPFAKCVGKIMEDRVVDNSQYRGCRPLDDFVLQNRYPDGSPLSTFFVYPHSLYRCSNVLTSAQPLMKIIEVFIKIFSILFRRNLVHTGGLALAHLSKRFLQQMQVDPVDQRCEHRFRIAVSQHFDFDQRRLAHQQGRSVP